jgi:Ca-activated chloride channel homolog
VNLSFAQPEWLVLLLGVPLVMRSPQRRALRFPAAQALSHLPRGRADRVPVMEAVLRCAVVMLLALAAAGPRVPDLKTRLPSEGIAIQFVIDVSGSMAVRDFSPDESVSRLDAARIAIRRFVEARPSDTIGVTAFAAWPRTESPPTLNHSVLLTVLGRLTPRSGVDAGTNIGDALADGLLRLQRSTPSRKVIILLSDGEHNVTPNDSDTPLTPRQAAQLAANLGVAIHVIDCGGDPSRAISPEAQTQRRDGRTVLESVAGLTGGAFFIADDAAQLDTTLDHIAALETSPIIGFQYRRYREFDRWLGLVAMLIGMMLLILKLTIWRRVPT